MKTKPSLIVIFFIASTWSYGQEILGRWKDIEKVGWKENKDNYWLHYYSKDSTSMLSYSYDSLNKIHSVYSFIADGVFKPAYDSTLVLTKYQINGPEVEFYNDMKVKSVKNYFADIPIGKWLFYFPNGQIERIENYPSDSLFYSLCSEYSIGTSTGNEVISIGSTSLLKSVPHGEWIEYYENGQIKAKKYFYLGLATGLWEWFYENGNKRKEGSYFEDVLKEYPCVVDSVIGILVSDVEREEVFATENIVHLRPKDGQWKYCDIDGNWVLIQYYIKGKLVKEEK